MADKDIALALLQAAVAVAGLVLVYSAFLASKAESLQNTKRAKKFALVARLSLVPVVLAIFCALVGVRVLLPGHCGSEWAVAWLILMFEILLVITGIYAIIAAFLVT